MPQIRWTKDDVIKKFQEAMTPQEQPKVAGPGALETLLSKIKRKPVEGEETV